MLLCYPKATMTLLKENADDILTELGKNFILTRKLTARLCSPLSPEDAVVQSDVFASPAKWHLAHTSWFFEKFILEIYEKNFRSFNDDFNHFFNSYYNSVGDIYSRKHRGLLTRPSLEEIYLYRKHVNEKIIELTESCEEIVCNEIKNRLLLGINHEQQHQELLLTDIKNLFWHNPSLPAYQNYSPNKTIATDKVSDWIEIGSGIYEIGAGSENLFAFDNETPTHRVFLNKCEISSQTVTNGDFINFIKDGGYQNPVFWLSDGWDVKNKNGWETPLYWVTSDKKFSQFTLSGIKNLNPDEPVCHLSFYEADAYARWAGCRLPTEIELEIAGRKFTKGNNFLDSNNFHPLAEEKEHNFMGNVWEWSNSSYLPYPGYSSPKGALGEYNGKFMINQMVLKGGSCLTPKSHVRPSYRNFFYPQDRWQMTGFRIAKN